MQTFISILRGINVGKNQLKMADLKAVYESLKCKNVNTYIQSGNVICTCPASLTAKQLSTKVAKKILELFAITTPIICLAVDEMEEIIAANPFVSESSIEMDKLHVTFLAEAPQQANIDKILQCDYPPDRFIIINKAAYLYCPVSYGNSKLSPGFFESKLKVTTTTRNWRTVNTLAEMAGEFKV